MNALLTWRTVTPSVSSKFMVKGTELSAAVCGLRSRFQICEHRCYDAERNADRNFAVRDAQTVSDADVRNGKRPLIVAWFGGIDEALAYVENNSDCD